MGIEGSLLGLSSSNLPLFLPRLQRYPLRSPDKLNEGAYFQPKENMCELREEQ